MPALLVYCQSRDAKNITKPELMELAGSAGLNVVFFCYFNIRKVNAHAFLSKGLLAYLDECLQATCADQLIFSQELLPKYQRNLSRRWQHIAILDINELILDIFAKRARTRIGQLQVELAQNQHLATRLVKGWTHLERQKGGIGLRGPGETQLETDRRLLKKRINKLKDDLISAKSHLQQARKQRMKKALFQVSLVGYTNAGKSTLFNRLTDSEIYANQQMFATLDPTIRRLNTSLPILICDTVGFMSCLPQVLINAFQATLDELQYADLILHVVDISHPDHQARIQAVDDILKDMDLQAPRLMVYNQCDRLKQKLESPGLLISALRDPSLDTLYQSMMQHFHSRFSRFVTTIGYENYSQCQKWLHTHTHSLSEKATEEGMYYEAYIDHVWIDELTQHLSTWQIIND